MDLTQAGETARAFLIDHAKQHNFWTPQEVLDAAAEDEDDDGSTMILCPTRVEPDPRAPDTLWISYTCGVVIDVDRLATHNRPEQRQRVEEAIVALRAAHPELAGIMATVELGGIDGGAGPKWNVTL